MTLSAMSEIMAAAVAVFHRRHCDDVISVDCIVVAGDIRRTGRLLVGVNSDLSFCDLVSAVTDGVSKLDDELVRTPASDASFGFIYADQLDAPETWNGLPVVAVQPGSTITVRGPNHALSTVDATGLQSQISVALDSGRATPTTTIGAIVLANSVDLATIADFSGNDPAFDATRSIPLVFADRVKEHPDAVAVQLLDRELTYRELDEASDQIARTLQHRDVGSNRVVGVLCHPSVEQIIGLLGILKARCAYLGLDPADPSDRREDMLTQIGATTVLSGSGVDTSHATGVEYLPLESTDGDTDVSTYDHLSETTSQDLAYVSFTSGSTGEPKGVAVPHSGVLRLLRNPNWITIGPEDVFIQVSPIAFDASTIEIWGALLNGAKVVIYPHRPLDLADLAYTIERDEVSVLLLATGLFHQMVADCPNAFNSVRHVLTGGDVASAGRVRDLFAKCPNILFTNGYGPTENTSYTTCWTTSTPPAGTNVSIGRPINGSHIAVLDDGLQLVPLGVLGELYVSGVGLAHGYLGLPGLTAERFVAVPESVAAAGRMYRTGDVVRWTAQGEIEFVGRADRQVKVRGFRVEPGHVEEELLRADGVRHAAVVPQRDAGGQHRLLAYIVPDGTGTVDLIPRVTTRLNELLPAYMVPWAIMLRDDLPLNRNGKVDHSALPASGRMARMIDAEYVAPMTPRDRAMAELWGEVLLVEPVGIHDGFFDLGGYSLLAAELLGRMKREMHITVTAGTLYRFPTINGLLSQVDDPA